MLLSSFTRYEVGLSSLPGKFLKALTAGQLHHGLRLVMQPCVIAFGHDFQVFNPVVMLVLVDVVHDLVVS